MDLISEIREIWKERIIEFSNDSNLVRNFILYITLCKDIFIIDPNKMTIKILRTRSYLSFRKLIFQSNNSNSKFYNIKFDKKRS